MKFFLVFLVLETDILLKLCKLDDDFIFPGKTTDPGHNMKGISEVRTEKSVEKSDDKTEFNMICEPEKPFQNLRMNQKVINGAQKPPVKGELGTDDALDVAPVFRIVPKPDFHADNKNHPCNEFEKSDAESHEREQNGLLQMGI